MFTTTKTLLSTLPKKQLAVPAFNFTTSEVARAIVSAAEKMGVSVILQTNQKEAGFLEFELAASIARYFGNKARVSVSLHLDHTDDPFLIHECVRYGYSSVMADFDEEEKVKETVGFCHGQNVLVEGRLSDYAKATHFLEETGIDFLAPENDNVISLEELSSLREVVSLPMVLHGSSSKPDGEIKKAISLGVVKFNWNTCLRQSWRDALLKSSKKQDPYRPYEALGEAERAVYLTALKKIALIIS